MAAPLFTVPAMTGAAVLSAGAAYLAASRLSQTAKKVVARLEVAVVAALVATIALTRTVL